jgi:FMN phosphatase YigB (HAD superfamily)
MLRYKYLFVDWHLTLSTSIFWEHLSNPAHPHYPLFDYMQSMLFHPSTPGRWLLPWMRGQLTSEEVVADVCQGTDFDAAVVLEELIVSCQRMALVDETIPASIAHLRTKGLRVVIATDNMDTFHRWTAPSLRLYDMFDDILSSYELQALKEDKDQAGQSLFFSNYLQAQHIGPGESLLLDDGDENFGKIIRQFGIDFQHIEPGRGLVPALQTILASL